MFTHAVVCLLPPLFGFCDEDGILHYNLVATNWQLQRVSVGGIFNLENREGIHGDTARLPRGCDTCLQEPRIVDVGIREGTFIVRFRDVCRANLDTFPFLDFDARFRDWSPMSFGHVEEEGEGGRYRSRNVHEA